ncbi:alpha-taxilin [Galendromus occidentalis]|uniref:Alpha-taxilin n=1 Tax=Galendromus occidentalis TaxID=34638 RepID=A0AAJ7L898_9ACAR|nr:alpha-taxilin [Galendromus occidentalis]
MSAASPAAHKSKSKTKTRRSAKKQNDAPTQENIKADVAEDTPRTPPTAEELARLEALATVAAEKSALENERMNDKGVRSLAKTLSECKETADEIKAGVQEVLGNRQTYEAECIKLEKDMSEKLEALSLDVQKSAKECTPEEAEAEVRSSIPPSMSKEKRSSKSATPPPVEKDKERAIQEKILDLTKQEPKKLSTGSKKKGVDSILRSLTEYETAEEKLKALCEMHFDTLEELKEAQSTVEKWKKQVQAGQKDCNRMLLARDRLEGLCRELQKQNSAIKEESLLRRREEDEKRKQIAGKFQTTLTDISELMADTQETSSKLREDNAQLANKLRTLVNHYENWEKHMSHMLKQKSIEIELANAKLRESLLHREKDSKEGETSQVIMETTIKQLQQQLEASLRNEIGLREQLKIHNEKYEEFQEAVSKSNKMFSDFKGEIDAMSKQTRRFEKEALHWKQRWTESNVATARVLQEKTKSDLRVETLTRLCRSLQEKLKLNGAVVAGMESDFASKVITEEKAKLEAELEQKKADIEAQKKAIQEKQKEMQLEMLAEDLKAKAIEKEIAKIQEEAAAGDGAQTQAVHENPQQETAEESSSPKAESIEPVKVGAKKKSKK